jgi:hypothetical protein
VAQGVLAGSVGEGLLKPASAQLRVPDPPGKKLGWAIVGLGRLSINQILPALAKCEKSKVVAFVSGHPDKAKKLALRYGINPKNIYNYQNYDSIKDNPEVDVIYIVLPKCTLNTQFAAFRQANTCFAKSRWRIRPPNASRWLTPVAKPIAR